MTAARPIVRFPMLVLFAIAVGSVALTVQITVVIPVLPDLEREFDTDLATITWLYSATLLAGGIAGPLLSRFGDMHGRKRMLVAVLACGTAGAALCAVAQSIGVMIAGRALAGLGAAVIPLGIGILRDVLPAHRVSLGIGVVSATLGTGGGIGIIMTGLIVEAGGDFRTAMWVSAALAGFGLLLAVAVVKSASAPTGGTADFLGAAVFTASMVALLLAISQGNNWGWGSDRIRYLFVASVVLLLVTLPIERKARDPLIDLQLMRDPRTMASSLTGLLIGFALFATFTLASTLTQVPEELGYGFSATPVEVGIYLLPMTVGMLIFGVAAGPVMSRIGASFTTALGSAFLGLGHLWMYLDHTALPQLLGALALTGVGGGLSYAGLGAMTIEHVDPRQTAAASGMNGLVRLIGAAIATALIGSVLASDKDPASGAPADSAFELCFLGCGLAGVLGGVVALLAGLARSRERAQLSAAPAPTPAPTAEQWFPEPRVAVHDATGPVLGGVVRTASGRRVPDAVVTLVDDYGCEAGRTRGDDAGRFVLALPPPGPYLLVLSSPGWYPTAEPLLLPAHSVQLDLVLRPAAVPASLAY